MTTKLAKNEVQEEMKSEELTFKCRMCGQVKPLSQLRELRRFLPIVMACSDCDDKMCGSGRKVKSL